MNNYHQKAEGFFNFESYYSIVSQRLKNGDRAVEVGVYKGKSILYLAESIIEANKQVNLFAVDTFKGSVEHSDQKEGQIYNEYICNVEPLKHVIKTIIMPSVDAASTFDDKSLNFVFIDAAHDYDNVKADIQAWMPKVKNGGILAGHDYHHYDVKKAVDELLTNAIIYPGTVWEVTI